MNRKRAAFPAGLVYCVACVLLKYWFLVCFSSLIPCSWKRVPKSWLGILSWKSLCEPNITSYRPACLRRLCCMLGNWAWFWGNVGKGFNSRKRKGVDMEGNPSIRYQLALLLCFERKIGV